MKCEGCKTEYDREMAAALGRTCPLCRWPLHRHDFQRKPEPHGEPREEQGGDGA